MHSDTLLLIFALGIASVFLALWQYFVVHHDRRRLATCMRRIEELRLELGIDEVLPVVHIEIPGSVYRYRQSLQIMYVKDGMLVNEVIDLAGFDRGFYGIGKLRGYVVWPGERYPVNMATIRPTPKLRLPTSPQYEIISDAAPDYPLMTSNNFILNCEIMTVDSLEYLKADNKKIARLLHRLADLGVKVEYEPPTG